MTKINTRWWLPGISLFIVAAALIIPWGRDTNWSYFYAGVNRDALEQCMWKSLENHDMPDFLFFDGKRYPGGFTIDTDNNIYKNGVRTGRIVNATKDRLVVKGLSGKRSYYCCK